MARTASRYVSFEKLQARGRSAATVIKLMMACNDLQLANQSLFAWRKELPRSMKSKQIGAGMYFVRMQVAHLAEGMKVIEEVKKDPTLMAVVRRCDKQTQQSFKELEQFLPASKHKLFRKLAFNVRDNVAFHYDETGKLIKRAISDRAGRSDARITSITRGDTAYMWHFKVADDVVDSIVVRQLWAIPQDQDVRAEADRIADQLHQIFLWFVDFSGEFVWKYCES